MKKQAVALLLACSLVMTGIGSYAQEEAAAEETMAEEQAEAAEPALAPGYPDEEPVAAEDYSWEEPAAWDWAVEEEAAASWPAEEAAAKIWEDEAAAAEPEEWSETLYLEFAPAYFVNPAYEGLISESDLTREEEDVTAPAYADYYTTSLADAGAQLWAEMSETQNAFTIRCLYPDTSIDEGSLEDLMWAIWERALTYTEGSAEEEEFSAQCAGWAMSACASDSEFEEGLDLDLKFTVTYVPESYRISVAEIEEEQPETEFETEIEIETEAESETETESESEIETESEAEREEAAAEPEETETETEDDLPEFETMYYVNPVYAGILTEDDLVRADESENEIATISSSAYTTSIEEAGEELRNAMVNREVPFTIKYIYPGTSISNAALTDIVWDLWDVALAHTGVSTQGDYLRWQYGGWALSTSVSRGSQGMYLDMKFTVTFYTTYEEEQEVTARLQSVFSSLNLGCKNDYERVCAIYDYICANVTYDYDHLYNSTYYKQYSAYGALIYGTAVCQGYAVLLYRMLLEAGVDCRVITGEGGGDAHAWNIVCLNGKYYNVDATWDAGRKTYAYFLLPDSSFSDHAKSSDYAGSSFNSSYPMASSAYDPSKEELGNHHTPGDWIIVEEATCTEDGLREKICTVCAEIVEEEAIPALGHDYSITETTEPGCEAEGHVVEICSRCEHSYISEVLPATGHSYVEEVTEPTCLEGGYTDFTCTICGDTYEGNHTDPLGHQYADASIQAKCTEPGESILICTRCMENYIEGFTDPLGHDFQDGVCTRCHALQETEEPEHLHSYHETERVEATCEQSGWILFICEGCGATDTEEIPATGIHTYVESDYKVPTCDSHGYVIYTCETCGDTYEDELLKTEHEFETSDPVDPTCTEDGWIADICKNCGLSYEEILPALGHDPVKAEDGTWVCARCGEIVDAPETETPDTEETEPEPQTESEELIPETLGLYDITEAEITGIGEHYEYTGEEVMPVPTVTYNGKVLTAGIDYLLEYSHDMEIGFASVAIVGIGDYYGEVTFHYTIETMIDITVQKEWQDDGNAYGHRPDSIEVELLSSGEDTGIRLTLDESNDWTDTFTGLPRYKNDEAVKYTVLEISDEALQYYTPEITYVDEENILIVNEQEYFPVEEEILPSEEHTAVFEISTYLPYIDPTELNDGAFTMVFHQALEEGLKLAGQDEGFSVTIAGDIQIDPPYYTVTVDPEDGCSFHVEIDLTRLYQAGLISDDDLFGETEIRILFQADLDETGQDGSHESRAWYEIYNEGDLQFTSNEEEGSVHTTETEESETGESETEESETGESETGESETGKSETETETESESESEEPAGTGKGEKPARPPEEPTEEQPATEQKTKNNEGKESEATTEKASETKGSTESSGESTTSTNAAAETADGTPVTQYLLLMLLACGAFAAGMFCRRRRQG